MVTTVHVPYERPSEPHDAAMIDSVGPDLVVNDREGSRLVIDGPGGPAQLVYERDGDRLVVVHTEVPEALRRRGIGGELVRAAVEWASREGWTVVPRCPFARAWLRDHPDQRAAVAVDWKVGPSR
jgi:predicted GNAT family acetyltransferase